MIDDPSDAGSDPAAALETLAARHGVSPEAARHMLRALEAGGGTMAQFDHPEFGGMGQWFASGMVMVGRMNDHALKTRVSALCADLVAALPAAVGWGAGSAFAGGAASSQSQFSGLGGFRDFSEFGSGFGRWWPEGLGRPSSVGSQNTTRYAFFPESRRLALETDGRIALYDTGDFVVTGVSQQQGGSSSFRFSGPQGSVGLDALKRVDMPPEHARSRSAEQGGERPRSDPAPAASEARAPAAPGVPPGNVGPAPSAPTAQTTQSQSDVLSTLERLAELHRKGVLTEEEFSRKKAELLARL